MYRVEVLLQKSLTECLKWQRNIKMLSLRASGICFFFFTFVRPGTVLTSEHEIVIKQQELHSEKSVRDVS